MNTDTNATDLNPHLTLAGRALAAVRTAAADLRDVRDAEDSWIRDARAWDLRHAILDAYDAGNDEAAIAEAGSISRQVIARHLNR